MLSPVLLLIIIDWGISTGYVVYLDDYAGDLAVLACTQAQIRNKTDKVCQAASRVGLEINALKTKVMYINATLAILLTVTAELLECVDSFTYLGCVISRDMSP